MNTILLPRASFSLPWCAHVVTHQLMHALEYHLADQYLQWIARPCSVTFADHTLDHRTQEFFQ